MEVKRANGKVWIEGAEGFSPAEYASSVHGCQARILQALGEPITYDDLVCHSGFAFRIGTHEEMCPSAGHPCCGYMCMEGSNRALPWNVRLFERPPGGAKARNLTVFEAEARTAIVQSIDRVMPVDYGSAEDGLIIGYADEGRRWWCVHPYHKWGSEAFWHDEVEGFAGGDWPWGIVVWTEPKPSEQRVSDRDLTIAALQQTVDMWNTEKREEAYFVGEAAYAHWLRWLRDVESGSIGDPKAGMQGNGWCFDVLIHSRRIAGRWLKGRADDYGADAAKHLRVAADHYGRIAELCAADLNSSWDLALPPNRFADWTGELRRDQIARLEAARGLDRTAVAAIQEALESLT